ncbi:MAG: hypothetical protein EOP04_30050 [Proteobacteria bacterium]|nr:MAG: hypothetical protein EOP04_30050 [Pseudomonadota bacterium]
MCVQNSKIHAALSANTSASRSKANTYMNSRSEIARDLLHNSFLPLFVSETHLNTFLRTKGLTALLETECELPQANSIIGNHRHWTRDAILEWFDRAVKLLDSSDT